MYRHSRHQATVAEIEAYAATVRAEFARKGFRVDPNSYGVRIECLTCHDAKCGDAEMWARNHSHHGTARTADFKEETVNADGTRNVVLYYS